MSRSRFLQAGQPPPRPYITAAIVISLISMVAGWIGDAIWIRLIDDHPLLLMTLNPRNRILALVSKDIDPMLYYPIGFARLVFSDPVNYLLGLWFGERAISWIARRSRTYGPVIRDGAVGFSRYAPIIVFLFPNNIVCAMAGITGVRVRTFVIANVTGTLTWLFVIRQFSSYFSEPIDGFTGFLGQYRTPILIVSILAVGWSIFGEFRGDNSELKTLTSLDEELDGAAPTQNTHGEPDATDTDRPQPTPRTSGHGESSAADRLPLPERHENRTDSPADDGLDDWVEDIPQPKD